MKRIPFFLLFILFWSCDEDRISFIESQPQNVEADDELRNDFQGRYFSESDSTWLIIKPKAIAELSGNFDFDISGEHVKVTNDKETVVKTEILHDSSIAVKVNIDSDDDADSVHVKGEVEERIFDMSKGHIAKFFKGYYFLNLPLEDDKGFKVRILRQTKEGLLLCRIQSDSLLKLMEDEEFIDRKKSDDNDQWTLHPSRKELKKLIDRGLFSDIRVYRKMD